MEQSEINLIHEILILDNEIVELQKQIEAKNREAWKKLQPLVTTDNAEWWLDQIEGYHVRFKLAGILYKNTQETP